EAPGRITRFCAQLEGDTHMPKKIPGTREEDSWFSEEQLEHLVGAEDADELRSPIPTQMVSNGEYLPNPQTPKQKEVEFRIGELANEAAKKLGVSRRQFLASSGGMAAAFEPAAHAQNAPPK